MGLEIRHFIWNLTHRLILEDNFIIALHTLVKPNIKIIETESSKLTEEENILSRLFDISDKYIYIYSTDDSLTNKLNMMGQISHNYTKYKIEQVGQKLYTISRN